MGVESRGPPSLCSGGCKGGGFDPSLKGLSWGPARENAMVLEPSVIKRKILVELGRGPINNYEILN